MLAIRSTEKKLGNVEFECDEKIEAALNFAEKVAVKKGTIDDDTFKKLPEYYNEDEILEIVLVICLYMFLNTFNNLID